MTTKTSKIIFFQTLKIEFQASANTTMIDVETAKHVELLCSANNPKSSNSLFGLLNRFLMMSQYLFLLFQSSTTVKYCKKACE